MAHLKHSKTTAKELVDNLLAEARFYALKYGYCKSSKAKENKIILAIEMFSDTNYFSQSRAVASKMKCLQQKATNVIMKRKYTMYVTFASKC